MQLVAELKTKQNLSNLTEVKPLRFHKDILYLKNEHNTFWSPDVLGRYF